MPRKILVTGASSGIGRAVSERLLDAGHSVVAVARDFSKFAPELAAFHPVSIDLVDLDRLPQKLEELSASHPDMDGAVLNAGAGQFKNLEEFSHADIRAQIDLNLTSHIHVARAILASLKKNAASDLILMGSESALRGRRRGSLYCAAKFALRGFAQALREECASSGLRITLINPGSVKTAFFESLHFRPGEDEANAILPEEVANVVLTVLSARAGLVFDEINLTPLKRVIRLDSGKKRGPDAGAD